MLKEVSLFILVLVILVAAAVAVESNSTVLSAEDKAAIVETHNLIRASVDPPAKHMPELVWDDELATSAQNWVNSCVSASKEMIDINPSRSTASYAYVGENIYASNYPITNVSNAVLAWSIEKKFYNLTTDSCQGTESCNHYTQVIWASTLKVGCGRGYCANLNYTYALVCDYGPGGNIITQKPYVAIGEGGTSPLPSSKPEASPSPNPNVSPSHIHSAQRSSPAAATQSSGQNRSVAPLYMVLVVMFLSYLSIM